MTGEVERLRGTWRQIAYERDGVADPPDEQGWEPRVTFTGDTFVVRVAGGSTPVRGTLTLDPARDPKAIDRADTAGEDAGKTLLAIYSPDGDRFTFCAADPGRGRPTAFRTKPGQVLRVHQRESP